MRHKKYENMIVLSFYDELSSEEKVILDEHLGSCMSCMEFRTGLAKFFDERAAGREAVTERLVQDARRRFREALGDEIGDTPGRESYLNERRRPNWVFSSVPAYALGISAFIMLAVGLAAGHLFFAGRSGTGNGMLSVVTEISSKNAGDVAISDVRFLGSGKESGEVSFTFNLIRRYEMSGSIDNADVQRVLAYALVNSDNPGVRLRSIGMLDVSPKPDKEIEDALIRAVETDENAGVRREALLSLGKLPFDRKIRGALLYVLQNDKNPGMRVAAINSLAGKELENYPDAGAVKGDDSRLLDVLREKSTSDQNRYVRLKAADMLKELKEL